MNIRNKNIPKVLPIALLPSKNRNSLGRAADFVFGEVVVRGCHGQPDAVLVVLEGVAEHVGVEIFQQRKPGVGVIVDVVGFSFFEKKSEGKKTTRFSSSLC